MLAGDGATEARGGGPARVVAQVREAEYAGVEALPTGKPAGGEAEITATTLLADQARLRALQAGREGALGSLVIHGNLPETPPMIEIMELDLCAHITW
jgi:hypothetical protein